MKRAFFSASNVIKEDFVYPFAFAFSIFKKMLVQFGNWIFHYRNFLFPLFYAALFIPSPVIFRDITVADIIGIIFIITGILIRSITIGLVYIVRGGRNRQIYAENLVTTGIYSVCRNPMYLGNILLLFGFGIFANSLYFVLILFPLFVLFYVAIIKAEEAFLFHKFGQEFNLYRIRVNALIPNLGKISTAFDGRRFDFKKVLKKEYNSLYIYLSGILLLVWSKDQISPQAFVISFFFVTVAYLIVKELKARRKLD